MKSLAGSRPAVTAWLQVRWAKRPEMRHACDSALNCYTSQQRQPVGEPIGVQPRAKTHRERLTERYLDVTRRLQLLGLALVGVRSRRPPPVHEPLKISCCELS